MADLEAKMQVSDTPPAVYSRTAAQLAIRYEWSARVIAIRKELTAIFASQFTA